MSTSFTNKWRQEHEQENERDFTDSGCCYYYYLGIVFLYCDLYLLGI